MKDVEVGKLITSCGKLEQILRKKGATGNGLKELIDSCNELTYDEKKLLKDANHVRNHLAHGTKTYNINAISKAISDIDNVIERLENQSYGYIGSNTSNYEYVDSSASNYGYAGKSYKHIDRGISTCEQKMNMDDWLEDIQKSLKALCGGLLVAIVMRVVIATLIYSDTIKNIIAIGLGILGYWVIFTKALNGMRCVLSFILLLLIMAVITLFVALFIAGLFQCSLTNVYIWMIGLMVCVMLSFFFFFYKF